MSMRSFAIKIFPFIHVCDFFIFIQKVQTQERWLLQLSHCYKEKKVENKQLHTNLIGSHSYRLRMNVKSAQW